LCGGAARTDRPDIGQRYRNHFGADRNGETLRGRRESELKRKVCLARTSVIDGNFVQRVVIEVEIVGSALWILQRYIVGNKGDVPRPALLVTVAPVEICAIHAWARADKRRFAMA
jgi:hypothetical protein